jgi:hypothetical protein
VAEIFANNTYFLNKLPNIPLHKNQSSGTMLLYVDRNTDMMKITAFHNFANTPNEDNVLETVGAHPRFHDGEAPLLGSVLNTR